MKCTSIVAAAALLLLLAGCGTQTPPEATPPQEPQDSTDMTLVSGKHHVEIEVKDYGTIALELDADAAPITVTNFLNLAKAGFYDGLTFHRVVSGFMIQGGDPDGNGSGGSDQTIAGEFSENGWDNPLLHNRGVISMARTRDPDSASSQFFIVHQESENNHASLDGKYAAFGKVTSGMEVVDKICDAMDAEGLTESIPADKQPVMTAVRVLD